MSEAFSSKSNQRDWRQWIPALLIAAGVLAYSNSLRGPFIFDDIPAVVENTHVQRLWPLSEAMSAPKSTPVAGRPVVSMSLALNFALGGLSVVGYHVFNLAVHLANALLLFGIMRWTLRGPVLRERFAESADGLAGAIALVWLLHPLQTEAVNYIIQRTELMMSLFLLLTLYCLIRGAAAKQSRNWYLGAIMACGLGMGSKEVMVGGPLIVLLYDRTFLSGSFKGALRQRQWLYVGLAATWGILAVLVAQAPRSESAGFGFAEVTPWDYVRTQCEVILHYFRLSLWPQQLAIDYADWPIAKSIRAVLPAGIILLALLGLTAWALWQRAWWGFWVAWFFVILAPTSSFLPIATEVAAERRMYLPLVSVIIAAVLGGYTILAANARRWGMVIVAVLALICAVTTMRRNTDYHDAVSIWRDAVKKRPVNWRAHNNLGAALESAGKNTEAFSHYRKALDIKPDYAPAHYNIGMHLANRGHFAEACVYYRRALGHKGIAGDVHHDLALTLEKNGQHAEAITHFNKALQLKPTHPVVHYNFANLLARQGRATEAISYYEQAIRLRPDYAEAHNNLAALQMSLGDRARAVKHYSDALRARPDWLEVQLMLAWILATSEDAAIRNGAEAVRLAERAAQLTKHSHPAALDVLAAAYAEAGRFEEAVKLERKALEYFGQPETQELAEQIQERLQLYRSGKPFRERGSAGRGKTQDSGIPHE